MKFFPLLLVMLAGAHSARASWSPVGNPVCTAPGAQHDAICVLPWIVWTDDRSGTPQLYAAMFDWPTGIPSPANGFPIAPSAFPQDMAVAAASSYDGSLIVAWSEDRGTGSGSDVYAMHLEAGAPDAGWPATGLPVCGAAGEQRNPRILLGVIFTGPFAATPLFYATWEDARDGVSRLYATDITFAGGTRPGWPTDGLLVSAEADAVRNAGLVAEDTAFVAIWESGGRVSAQALAEAGIVPGNASWPAAGRTLSDTLFAASAAVAVNIDNPANVVVAWEEQRGDQVQIRAQGWAQGSAHTLVAQAIPVVDDPSARPLSIELFSGGYEQALLFWQDDRGDPGDLYSSVVAASAKNPPWLSAYGDAGAVFVQQPGEQGHVTRGWGAFWQDSRSGTPQIYSELSGYPPYPPGGARMAPTSTAQTQPSASHDVGNFVPENPPSDVVVWTDMRNPGTGPDLYAQVLGPGGPGTVSVLDQGGARLFCSNARPTPTRGATAFELELPLGGDVELAIADVSGRTVRSLVHGTLGAGHHTFAWDGLDAGGRRVAPGLYWLHGRAGRETLSRRVVVIPR